MGFRDFVFIDDALASIIKTINYKNKYDLFNICARVKTTVKKALNNIFDVFNVPNHQIIVEEGKPRDQFGIYGNATKIEKELDWKYQTDLDEGLKRMIKLTNFKRYR